jgi:1-deoxy-D-xylulose 5-phosphate reductoisomerase
MMINYYNVIANEANHKAIQEFLNKNLHYKKIKRSLLRQKK